MAIAGGRAKSLTSAKASARHEDELEERAESNVLRMIEDALEVAGRKAHAIPNMMTPRKIGI